MDLASYLEGFTRSDWEERAEGTVRFAVVGLGWWTREQALPALDAAANCAPTVAVSGSAEKREEAVAAHESVEHGLAYDAFLDGEAADAYDAVYVCTPNALHLPYVEGAAALGKAVLCEKPLEASVERAERLVTACEDAGVTLMTAYRLQTDPAVRHLRDLVADGIVGDPAFVHGHMSQPLLEVIPDPDQWRLDPELAGEGGSVTDLGVYPVNTARFVLARVPVAVSATTYTGAPAFESVPDERASFLVTLEGGVQAACSASQNAHRTGQFTVVGTEGEVSLVPAYFEDADQRLTVTRGDTTAVVEYEPVDQMRAEFAYFADRLLAGRPVEPDGRHGLVDMRVVEAVYEAARTGERVRL